MRKTIQKHIIHKIENKKERFLKIIILFITTNMCKLHSVDKIILLAQKPILIKVILNFIIVLPPLFIWQGTENV